MLGMIARLLTRTKTDAPESESETRSYAPHCDSAVLHAPGECEYCDEYPDWQHYRIVVGVAFTGHDPKDDQTRCPSEQRRPIGRIERWVGNRPKRVMIDDPRFINGG